MASSSSSSVITYINSALDNVDLLLFRSLSHERYIFRKLRYRLRNLKTFVLLAGKFGNVVHWRYYDSVNKDERLGSPLIRIEVASQKIHSTFIGLKDIVPGRLHTHGVKINCDFLDDFQSLKEEIDQWYITMSDNKRQLNSPTADEVGEITESIWDNLVDFSGFSEVLEEAMEVLREHMNFLKNFRSFATRRGVDDGQMKDFLIHTVAVALSAAHICFLCEDELEGIVIQDGRATDCEEWRKRMRLKISLLVQKIKPIDPQVCDAYTQVISCSKLSTRLDAPTPDMDDNSTVVMKNFVDSLIAILWDMLRLDTFHVVCFKDNWQLLYEGLRSMRTILKKLHNSIDEKTRDDIGVVVCDAGGLVCSFYRKNVEIDRGLQDLLERIKVFVEEVGEKVPQASIFNSSSINEPCLVDFLLENLTKLTNGQVEPIFQSHVQSIKEGLLYLRSFLEEIANLRYGEEERRAFRNRVLNVAYRVEFLIDHLIVGDISDSFSMQFDSVMEDIHNIKTDSSKSSPGKIQDIKVHEVTSTSSPVLPSQKMASLTTEIVGLRDEASSVMGRLRRGSRELRVIAIVGMGGIGKTTLAAKVYDDPEVIRYFSAQARCTVSQTLDKKKLLLELLDQIHAEKCSELTEDDLANKLRKHLKGKRYLIFLDDVWTIEAWNSLKASFPDDSTGSRIILTSRNRDAAPLSMLDQEPLFLRKLGEKQSMELLKRKLFPGEDWPHALYDLRMQIVEKCKGLPLTIVLVAGLLATTEKERWKEIVDGLSSGTVSIPEQCMSSMELSYKYLPHYLKPCFLYFGAFPEGREFSVKELIRLWIAEGFIRKSQEDVAEDYMRDLIGRSLITVDKQRSIGGAKTCRIHDLLHDFCLKKAKDEHFFHMLKGHDELLAFNEPCNLRRLCIHSEPKHFKESMVFCPRARSLVFFNPKRELDEEASIDIFLVHIFKFVSVLDLDGVNLGQVFPSEIELLVQLRYLAIRGRIREIPSWVDNLSMLETFIVDPCSEQFSFPDTIWNLQKLKYLYIRNGSGRLPLGNPDNSSVLHELDTISRAKFSYGSSSMEEQMRKFPNIRKLKCTLFWLAKEVSNIGIPDFLRKLESLHMILKVSAMQFEFSFPANLKKLTLGGFKLPWSKLSTIGKLPNLEVLKLLGEVIKSPRDCTRGKTWEMEEGEFPKLKFLKLHDLDLVRWTASDDQFPCLEKLVLEKCLYLEEMPSCLESTETLEMIEVWYCSKATSRLVKRIEEEQVNMGNSALEIRIHP